MTTKEVEEKIMEFARQLNIPKEALGWNIEIKNGKPIGVYFAGRIQS
jgi:hypothetical protein